MKKKLLVTMLTLAMAGSLMACAGKEGAAPASEAKTEAQTEAKAEDAKAEDTKAETEAAKDEAASGEKHLVGVAMPTKDLQRWNQDGSNMKAELEAAGYEAYLVGGAVRDFVRDSSPAKDWDIATNALPEQVKAVFAGFRLIETGLKHGTVTVVIDHIQLEITTYRVDGGYTDHRHPDAVSFTRSLKEDLERRDFTMNALAYHPAAGVVDLVGGRADIEAGLVRCVGDPDRRFREDGLRMLRALRFASVYGMTIEPGTAAAVHRNRALLERIAAERVQAELTKLLCGRGAAAVLRSFADVLEVLIPELVPMFGFDQRNPHHDRDVWEHTIAVVEHTPPEPVLRWAALFHDMGKPSCFSLTDGVGHFFGHAEQGAVMTERILDRLRFDRDGRERIARLVRYHDMPLTADRKRIKRLLSKHGVEAARQLIGLHRADTLGQSAVLPSLTRWTP